MVWPSIAEVHPRERGESAGRSNPSNLRGGPSPRARGIPPRRPRPCRGTGSIPASAGNPVIHIAQQCLVGVHPRERGESRRAGGRRTPAAGPSPRARGIRACRSCALSLSRSIPASAGNPSSRLRSAYSGRVHPRERGESLYVFRADVPVAGPSPRARGIRQGLHAGEDRQGSIPASAGNPPQSRGRLLLGGVHPRERGESSGFRWPAFSGHGPSPRARGIRERGSRRDRSDGSIPASAGNPHSITSSIARTTVHPRERGESRGAADQFVLFGGPSPRARGIPAGRGGPASRCGSIPASAGNPSTRPPAATARPVHPRERGESAPTAAPGTAFDGPSPRARGIHDAAEAYTGDIGSIPASAGNPRPQRWPARPHGVHPRERGESLQPVVPGQYNPGPSPRARGILLRRIRVRSGRGSIPASAGNPASRPPARSRRRVHPRERGESAREVTHRHQPSGPSPRARGIPAKGLTAAQWARSIPASAGNPLEWETTPTNVRVHPRERGESDEVSTGNVPILGPSPRARGIRRLRRPAGGCVRSIPASAGNPASATSRGDASGVHPRERGESRAALASSTQVAGPSPRARGIRNCRAAPRSFLGSIPASAGNPRAPPPEPTHPRVHPRERGESAKQAIEWAPARGPSPRARGIPGGPGQPGPGAGSIPASAGNPTCASSIPWQPRVHPRERGESRAPRRTGM